jgi:exonuclease III
VRILTWNIRHGAKSRVEAVLDCLQTHDPDIVVLTEFRNSDCGRRIRQGLESFGLRYQSGSHAGPSVNAVLVAGREWFAEQVFDDLGTNAHRCVLARIGEIFLFGLYFPNRQEKEPLFRYLVGLSPQYLQERSLLLGDFNTGKHHVDEIGATFICSQYFERLEALGWVDVWRHRYPLEREYTWYSYAGNGFRLDHAFASPPLLPMVRRVMYSHRERETKASDHSALIVEIE